MLPSSGKKFEEEYGDDAEWSTADFSLEFLDNRFKDLKLKWRDSQLASMKTYERIVADPNCNGDKISWAAPFIKSPERAHERSKSAGNSRRGELPTLTPSSDDLSGGSDIAKALSPERGRIRPKSANFKNTYVRVKL